MEIKKKNTNQLQQTTDYKSSTKSDRNHTRITKLSPEDIQRHVIRLINQMRIDSYDMKNSSLIMKDFLSGIAELRKGDTE